MLVLACQGLSIEGANGRPSDMPIRGDDGPKVIKAVTHALEPPLERRRQSGTIARVRVAATTVLVAEDDVDTRHALRMLLTAEGYEVIEASDGAQALEILARAADGSTPLPDVVLLDVLMPGYSGLGVLRAMRRFRRVPPTIIMTAFRDPSVEALARNLGAARVLRKPIEAEALYEAIFESAMLATSEPHQRGA